MDKSIQEHHLSPKREQALLAARLRSEGKTWPEIGSIFRERYGVNGHVALRMAHQLSQRDVADEWNVRWPDDRKSFKNISYWEQWPSSTGHQPSLVVLRRLAEIYACAVADLVADYADYRYLDNARRLTTSQKPHTKSALKVAEPGESAQGIHHISMPTESSQSYNPRSDIAVMEGFRVADRQVGGGNLYPAVIGYLRTTIAPRLFDIASDYTHRAVFTSASAMSEMAGWMSHDAGNDANARAHFRRSLQLAGIGKDFQLKAHILASLSHLSLHCGEPERAIQLAQEGRATLATAPENPGLAARLFSMEARGYAGLHVPNDYKCNENLELAAQALERHAQEQGSPWISNFDDGSLSSEAARCMSQLSRFTEAEYHARRIITLRSSDRTRSRAFGQLLLVGVLIAQGEPEEACEIAHDVLEATHSLGSYLILEQLNSVRANLAPFKNNKTVSTLLVEIGQALQARMAIYQIGDSSTVKEK